MILLSLDLGIKTGWAVLGLRPNNDPVIYDHGEVGEYDAGLVFPQLKQEWEPDSVLMEKPVLAFPGPLQDDLRRVMLIASAIYPHHETVTPSQWKPSPYSRYPLPRGTSKHVRDAVRMGVWWLKTVWIPANVTQ